MNTYTAGQIVKSDTVFTLTSTNAPVDPTTVVFKYEITDPAGTVTGPITLTYTGSLVPAPGVVAKTAVGNYEAQVDTTAKPGTWQYEWISTGTGQTAGAGFFVVEALPF